MARDNIRADQQIVLQRLDTNRRAIYATNLGLSEEESEAFWPIYDQYESAIKKVTDRRVELLNDYAERYPTLSDADADRMLTSIWQCERNALKIHAKYAKAIRKVLPGAKTLRYVQLQARIDSVLMGRVLSQMPLAN